LSEWIWPVTVLALCIAGWTGFSYLISYMSGWRYLARVYRASQPFLGGRWRPWAASMRWGVNYNGLLALGADSQGMHMSVFFLFRIGHPPLFIPWPDISASPLRSWWFRMARLEFEKYRSTYLLIPQKMAERLSHASGLQVQLEHGS